jgi:hypothetical protein
LNRTGGERKLDWSAGADKKKSPKKRERGTPDCHRAPASFGSIFKGLWVTPLLSQPEHFPASPWVTPTFELRRRDGTPHSCGSESGRLNALSQPILWTAAGSEAPRRFGSSIRNRKAVSPLRSATAVQNFSRTVTILTESSAVFK